jgi:coenzyme F420-reducing hydrogenase alpha subunit
MPNRSGRRELNMAKKRTIKVDYLARVEGEGGIEVTTSNGEVTDVKLRIFEPPRFFEALLRGRDCREAPDITARICGICPVAYQMSAVHAVESAFGIIIDPQVRALRRLLYCGEWIESHALHIYLLHAPDFLGYPDAIHMAKENPGIIERGLQLKKTGNEIMTLLCGREVHPINVRVGGFYRAPQKGELSSLVAGLKWARDSALETVRWTAGLPFPEFEQDYEFVALRHESEYPFNEGRIVSNRGLDITASEYDSHFTEEHVEHSNALHSVIVGRGAYHVGPLARFNLNFSSLPSFVQEAAREAGVAPPCRNPFRSIVVRSIEVLYACDEALRLISEYEPPARPAAAVENREATGYACTEAPRGMLYHRYQIGQDGLITDAKIVPPTSQNQKMIENDLRSFIPQYMDLNLKDLTWRCEQAVRNYDPCISCATHFLKLELKGN